MESPIKMDDLGVHLFLETPKSIFNTNPEHLTKKVFKKNPTIYINGVKPGSLRKGGIGDI